MRKSIQFLLNVERGAIDALHLRQLMSLPLLSRLRHPKTQRHILAVGIGASICCVGSAMAEHRGVIHPAWVWDALAYSIHGVGLGPILAHVEPLWKILTAD